MKITHANRICQIAGILVSLTVVACGKLNMKNDTQNQSTGQSSSNAGSASLQIADLSSLGDVKKVKITVNSIDAQAGSYSFTQTEDYTAGKTLVVANLPERAYTVTLEVSDGAGKVLATGVASNVSIKNGVATNLSIALSKTGPGGTLVVSVTPPTVTLGAPNLKTDSGLVGTMWTQPGVLSGYLFIFERYVHGSDGCNSFSHSSNQYFIFAPDGTIVENADFIQTKRACQDQETQPSFSSKPSHDWKSWMRRDGKLIITTATGETHTFTHPEATIDVQYTGFTD